jgi:flagellin-like protein
VLKIGKFKVSKRAVSPVIATLLMIAVAVAASVIVYVWSAGLLGTLMGGGGSQVKEQVILEAYAWPSTASLDLYLRNVGSSDVHIAAIYVGGSQQTGATPIISVKAATKVSLGGLTGFSSGTAYVIKIVTDTGGVFSFTAICGSSG